MRIIYGAFAQGQGHFSKAAVLVPLLESRGHDVLVVSSGWDTPPQGYAFRRHQHFPGLSYVVTDGRADYRRSFLKWLKESPQWLKNLWKVRRLVREYQPDLIISDFEPLTASPLLQPKCEVVCLSRQVTLCDREIPIPETGGFDRKLARSIFRLFTLGANRQFGYHYEPATFRCVPPVIRPELGDCRPEQGDHLLVYNHYDTAESGSPENLIRWSQTHRMEVRAYGFPGVERGRQGQVWFRSPGRMEMLDDMRTARAVFTSAGLTTPLEGFLLNKPVIAVPIPKQWEQSVNAFQLDRAGLSRASETWNYDLAFELAPPGVEHPLMPWLRTPADRVLDRVLPGDAPPVDPACRSSHADRSAA